MFSNSSSKYYNLGLLIIRLSIGFSFVYFHGWEKITGGVDKWEMLGNQMQYAGINFLPVVWGFMAALAEFGGGLLLMIGLFTRPAAFFMATTMLVANLMHYYKDGLEAHPFEMLFIFIALFIMGAGKYSLDAKIKFR